MSVQEELAEKYRFREAMVDAPDRPCLRPAGGLWRSVREARLGALPARGQGTCVCCRVRRYTGRSLEVQCSGDLAKGVAGQWGLHQDIQRSALSGCYPRDAILNP